MSVGDTSHDAVTYAQTASSPETGEPFGEVSHHRVGKGKVRERMYMFLQEQFLGKVASQC